MTGIEGSDYFKALQGEILKLGGQIDNVDKSGKHPKVYFFLKSDPSKKFKLSFPSTPASYNSKVKAIGQVRRLLRPYIQTLDKPRKDKSKKCKSKNDQDKSVSSPTSTRLSRNPFEQLKHLKIYKDVYEK
jgi:hypothetical protein